ncbi:TetR family transcriptional regulator [Mycolicibacterium fortuitum]|uniref:TetR family transcriptional regulator n=1 Tax=Mycolicibacterium fortuitum TaxID=1766 RepID=A0ABD6QD75_MYCFO|nr:MULTISPECIES: TetR/AcrR family transcriptional regulator [Mycolicibacterium]OMC34249.1 TetR family transcriptional regulator [Mycolicibacterium fortuitum]WKG04963.1 TetR/AcrR family transcriptional regulator [Mycolicibacterium sp. HK-90]
MGTREDLLDAAKKCLAERGYARTTVRDIAAASGANLAAINYHFGTRDALLHQAMLEASGEAVQQIFESLPADDPADPAARLDAFLSALIGSFRAKPGVWSANMESLAQALHSAELRAEIATAQDRARRELAQFGSPDGAAGIGAVLETLICGLLVQWVIDPDGLPAPDELTTGLRALTDRLPPA